jgi:hypothetical protein
MVFCQRFVHSIYLNRVAVVRPRERLPMTLLSSFILAVFTAVEPAAPLSRTARLSFGFQRLNSIHVRSLKCLNLLRFKLLVPTCRRRGSDTVYYWYKAEIFDKVVFGTDTGITRECTFANAFTC